MINARKVLVSLFVILCISVLHGCFKDPVIPPPDVSYKGGLAFKAINNRGNPIQGVTISIALSQEELHNGIYLGTRYTDADGRADFGLVNAGTYYYRADILIDDISFHLEGVVLVKAEVKTTQELEF